MDMWEAAQNWLLFGAVAGGLIWYYYPNALSSNKAAIRAKLPEHVVPAPSKKRADRDSRPRPKPVTESSHPSNASPAVPTQSSDNDATRGRKGKKPATQVQASPKAIVQNEEADEVDMSTRQFAQQMAQARKGHNLNAPKENEKRVKTVKQTKAKDDLIASSTSTQAPADDNSSSAGSPALRAGDVSDMLDPAPAGPKSLRLTGVSEAKQRAAKQPKMEMVETKKQRQNRQKVEERKLQREEEERQRKALEENQRRTAREARGEPAKNGVSVAKPTPSVWTPSQQQQQGQPQSSALLDTFDATSTSSSAGGFTTSSTATSTSRDDENAGVTMAQSIDESGWTTVAVPKKNKKGKSGSEDGAGSEALSNEAASAPVKSAVPVTKQVKAVRGEKPTGFQVLNDHYQQRSDVDPNDPDNWDA